MATGEFKYLKTLYVLKGDIFEFTHASSVDNQNTAFCRHVLKAQINMDTHNLK